MFGGQPFRHGGLTFSVYVSEGMEEKVQKEEEVCAG